MKEKTFFSEVIIKIALPITLQSMFQASFSVIDQLMTGQLGSSNVAAVGLCGKFSSLFGVLAAAVATAAGIMIAQYVGGKDIEGVSKSFFSNLLLSGGIGAIFTVLSVLFPVGIMSIYSKDEETIFLSAICLRIIAIGFLPMAGSMMISTLLRCHGNAKFPLYASITSAALNTALNYVMIFGKIGCPKMGIIGASWATTISRSVECIILISFLVVTLMRRKLELRPAFKLEAAFKKTFIGILMPILACEFLWSLGENVYAVVYGRMGTAACAAMTLTNPIQSLMIGALSGVASAAGIYIGKCLGNGETDKAYEEALKFVKYGLIGSVILSCILLVMDQWYVGIYQVEDKVKMMTKYILVAYAIIAPVKVQNMILSGGVIRSGGKTAYVMYTDMIGTWCVGVPLAIIFGLVLQLPIYLTYFILSLEECVRLVISVMIFKKKIWINDLIKQEKSKLEFCTN